MLILRVNKGTFLLKSIVNKIVRITLRAIFINSFVSMLHIHVREMCLLICTFVWNSVLKLCIVVVVSLHSYLGCCLKIFVKSFNSCFVSKAESSLASF